MTTMTNTSSTSRLSTVALTNTKPALQTMTVLHEVGCPPSTQHYLSFIARYCFVVAVTTHLRLWVSLHCWSLFNLDCSLLLLRVMWMSTHRTTTDKLCKHQVDLFTYTYHMPFCIITLHVDKTAMCLICSTLSSFRVSQNVLRAFMVVARSLHDIFERDVKVQVHST